MQTLIILFIFTRLYDFMNFRSLARMSQNMTKALENHKENPKSTTVFVIDKNPAFFLFSFLADILFLFFCVYLMFDNNTWTPGTLLLIISALESYAIYAKIDGTCYKDETDNYYYPSVWWRYITTGSSLFILTRLLELEKMIQ